MFRYVSSTPAHQPIPHSFLFNKFRIPLVTIDSYAFSFQHLTNAFPRNLFVFTTMQNARGGIGPSKQKELCRFLRFP